jgi:hypothetical protein
VSGFFYSPLPSLAQVLALTRPVEAIKVLCVHSHRLFGLAFRNHPGRLLLDLLHGLLAQAIGHGFPEPFA